ncbi:MAG TPA: N,N-dimethylformamidase beta subunit family domain-containing protein [Streptosporangiaceae bacterium]|nr:N,N-dimethylformamidase beta subunit family domain-containing protein [Streptosporangiaceae bacterium]
MTHDPAEAGTPAASSGSPTRRRFIGLAAAAAAIPIAGCTTDAAKTPAKKASAKSSSPKPKVAENSLQGDPNWGISNVGAANAMMGYAGQASVLPGQPITLYASTTAPSFVVRAFRIGWYNGDKARLLYTSPSTRGHQQPAPAVVGGTNTVECNWEPSLTIPTDNWPEGSYLLRMDAETGQQRYVPITVRSATTAGKVVIKNSTETWQAYNTWGGYDLYNGPGGSSDYSNRARAVSLDRPYDQSGAYYFLWHEQKLISLAEQLGLPVAYTTSMDIASEPNLLHGASALVCLGHDEYWTPEERATVTAARDAGVNIAFLGANTCFRRTRLASTQLGANRLVVCYKTSYTEDPEYGKNNSLVTNDYREPPGPNPESSLTGVLYESNPVDAPYVVASPDSWVYAGTGAQKGTSFTGLVGIEYDRVNPVYPVPRPIEVLSHSPLTCRGVNSYSDSAYYTTSSGAGVFATGTMRWVQSLGHTYIFGLNRRAWAFTEKVTSNVLHAFADGPAAAKYPAHDNLDSMREWPGDPIAAHHSLWPPTVL